MRERLEDRVGGDHRTHRRVGRGDALGRRDDVGLVVVALGAEPLAEPAPRADDLVGDEEDVVVIGDLAHALEVPLGRHEAPPGVLDRLQDDRRDRARVLELDAARDRLGEVCRVVALGQPVGVGVGHVAAAGRQRLEGRAQARDAGRGQAAHRRAVVGGLARDDLVLGPVASELVVLAGQLQRGLDGFAAAAGEEHAVEVAGREIGDLGGQLDRARMRVAPVGEEAELFCLIGTGLRHIGAAVADVRAEERAEAVEVALAVLVEDVAAVAADDDRDLRPVLIGAHAAEVHPQVALGELLKLGVARLGGRRHRRALPFFLSDPAGLPSSWTTVPGRKPPANSWAMPAQVRGAHLPQRPTACSRQIPVTSFTYPVTNRPFART